MSEEVQLIKPCPKCGSENLSLHGLSWLQVHCLDCEYCGRGHSYGSRMDRYNKAIISWNEGKSMGEG